MMNFHILHMKQRGGGEPADMSLVRTIHDDRKGKGGASPLTVLQKHFHVTGERGSLHFICQNGNMQFARHSQKISNFVIHNAEELPQGELVLHWDRKVEEAGRTSLLENEVRERKRFTDPMSNMAWPRNVSTKFFRSGRGTPKEEDSVFRFLPNSLKTSTEHPPSL
jgi:hypothetical protein